MSIFFSTFLHLLLKIGFETNSTECWDTICICGLKNIFGVKEEISIHHHDSKTRERRSWVRMTQPCPRRPSWLTVLTLARLVVPMHVVSQINHLGWGASIFSTFLHLIHTDRLWDYFYRMRRHNLHLPGLGYASGLTIAINILNLDPTNLCAA